VGSSDAYYRNVARYRIVEFVIRQAELGDAEGIAACLRAAFEPYRDAYTVGAFEDTVPSLMVVERRFEFMQMFVAVTGSGDAVGTIGYSVAGDEGHLRGMAVLPEWEGSGIARRLLASAEAALRAQGCSCVTLDTTAPLERAIRFYERQGYSRTGRVTDFFGMPLHEFRKELTTQR
jgi:ribosomal protein S18 acetylase RimI-like enzyme